MVSFSEVAPQFQAALIQLGVGADIAQVVTEGLSTVESHSVDMARMQTIIDVQSATINDLSAEVAELRDSVRKAERLAKTAEDHCDTVVTTVQADLASVQQTVSQLRGTIQQGMAAPSFSAAPAPAAPAPATGASASASAPAPQQRTQQAPAPSPFRPPPPQQLPVHLHVDPRAVERPSPFTGESQDAAVLGAFVEHAEQYFRIVGFSDEVQQANLALLWLKGNASVWWRTVRPTIDLATFTWPHLKHLMAQQFCPYDAGRQARDAWAVCVQGKQSVATYTNRFRLCLLRVTDAAPSEILDRYVRGLAPDIRQMVLMFNPTTFTDAATAAERAAGIRTPAVPPAAVVHAPPAPRPQPGAGPMELGVTTGGRTSPPRTRQPGTFQGNCHYCNAYGHSYVRCPKLFAAMQAARGSPQGQGRGGRGNPFARGTGGARGTGRPAFGNVFEGLPVDDVACDDHAPPADAPAVPGSGQ